MVVCLQPKKKLIFSVCLFFFVLTLGAKVPVIMKKDIITIHPNVYA